MNFLRICFLASCLLWLAAPVSTSAAEKVVEITRMIPMGPTVGNGQAQYIEVGKPCQLIVVVTVNDTVKFKNKTTIPHTVTSDLFERPSSSDTERKWLFDSEMLGGEEATISFDQAFYDRAVAAMTGAKPGDVLFLGYYCKPHADQMGSKIVLEPRAGAFKELLEKTGHK